MLKTQKEIEQDRADKAKFELDPVQEHFRTSNEPLIDGLPLSKFLARTKLIFVEGQTYELALCPNCLTKPAKYIGFQSGLNHGLNLFNCIQCGTTRAEKA